MENPKIVLGLKTAKIPSADMGESDDGKFFSSDSDCDDLLLANTRASLVPSQRSSTINKVVGFTDASTRITFLISELTNYKIPQKYTGRLYLIPEESVPADIEAEISQYVKDEINELSFSSLDYDDSLAIQIDLVLFAKGHPINLEKYTGCSVDPRLLSLVHYCLSQNKDHGVSAFHCISSLEFIVKSSGYAPVSSLFPDYTVENVILRIGQELVSLFPRHPILPSVIHSLAPFSSKIENVLIDSIENESEDFSDSFFESLPQIKPLPGTPRTLSHVFEENPVNPLEPDLSSMLFEAVSVSEPPTSYTYQITDDGKDCFQPSEFIDWIMSLRVLSKRFILPQKESVQNNRHDSLHVQYISLPHFATQHEDSQNSNLIKDYDLPFFVSLYSLFYDHQVLLNALPSEAIANCFHLYYPTLQFLNSLGAKAPVKRGCIYPGLISNEHEAHYTLKNPKIGNIAFTIENFLRMIPADTISRASIYPLQIKRRIPALESPSPPGMLAYLSMIDLEFILSGRSPLTCQRICGPQLISGINHPALIRSNRYSSLYQFYIQNDLPPYIAFRCGFAIAVSIADARPDVSCQIIFESLCLIHQSLPQLARSPIVRSAVLFFAESLERYERYYYAALLFDNYFLSDPTDSSSASAIAQIAQRNRDMIRSVFHYTESVKSLIQQNKCDESLYIGQIISSIFSDSGLDYLAISTLSFLLRRSYNIGAGRKIRPKVNSGDFNGSLKLIRPSYQLVTPTEEFRPDPSAINTILVCTSFINILIRNRMFNSASHVLSSLQKSMDAPILPTVISYLKAKLYLKKNYFNQFLESIPVFDIRIKKSNSSSKISLLYCFNFDATSATLRLLARSHIDRHLFGKACFWSEVLLHSSAKKSLKEIGIAYLLRGISLSIAYQYSCYQVIDTLIPPLTTMESRYASLTESNDLLCSDMIISEALSSLNIARNCFDKVGNLRKSIEASLRFVDLILQYYYDPLVPGIVSDKELEIKQPQYFTNPKFFTQSESFKPSIEKITGSLAIDEAIRISLLSHKNSSRIMHPILILYSQVLLSKSYAFKGKPQLSKSYFDFAYQNLKRYYTNGSRFLFRRLPFSSLRVFEHIITLMSHQLFFYDSAFINDHLLIIDVFNDIKTLISNRMRVITPDSQIPLSPSIDMDAMVLELNNLKHPDFLSVLRDSGLLQQDDKSLDINKLGLEALLKRINANIRLFETQKLTESEMNMKNKSICYKMETKAKSIRQNSHSVSHIDTSYSSSCRQCPGAERVVFIIHLFDVIITYIPKHGLIHKKELQSSLASNSIVFNNEKIQFYASFFSYQFLQLICDYIYCNKKQKDYSISLDLASPSIEEAKLGLFGSLLEDSTFLSNETPIVPDDHRLGQNWFQRNNGTLTTISPMVDNSIVFILSSDLHALPIEIFFPKALVFRSPSYSQILMYRSSIPQPFSIPPVILFRRNEPRDILHEDGIVRSIESITQFIGAIGGCQPKLPLVDGVERISPFPFPLFSSNKPNNYYEQEYSFCSIINTNLDEPPKNVSNGSLLVFTYSDMCEMPLLVEKLVSDYPRAYFMFIPSKSIREAFKIMKKVFLRQLIRQQWAESNTINESEIAHLNLSRNNGDFIAALQIKLRDKLNVPIPLYFPINK